MIERIDTSLGELITVVYEEYLALYGDQELALVAAAATINDMLNDDAARRIVAEAEAA